MKKGQVENAERRALNIFDEWVEVTGFVAKHCGYYYEMQENIKEAVHCGIQEALGEFRQIGESKCEIAKFKQTGTRFLHKGGGG